jgi:eukaryotic-like serine/threonine-protein kinase
MRTVPACNEDLIGRLPLPLAQLYRRAHNAKTPQERHHAAYYLWEASLKLLGSVAVVAYAELGDQDPELADRLRNLARPAVGHWWEFVRRLVAVLAAREDAGFVRVRDVLLGRARDDLPHAAGLDAVLCQVLDGREAAARTTVRLTELFDRLVRYRNQEFGHGAVGQRPAAVYDRVGRALMAGVPEVLCRLDPLAGRRLVYVADVRRQAGGRWLAERYELRGEAARRLESLDLPDSPAASRLLPDGVYLEPAPPAAGPGSADGPVQRPVSLHPLIVYDAEAAEALFLNARRGCRRADYLSYTTGREVGRDDLAEEQRDLLARVLRVPVDPPSVTAWAARSQAEEPAAGPADDAPRRLGEFELLSELGRGGMGVVYRAWQPSLGRQVALKALFRTGDPKAEARFAREIRALGHVEHPHVVKIFTSGSDGDQWFYAMELIEGATLAAVCDKLGCGTTRPEALDMPTWLAAVSTVCAEARQAEKPLSGPAAPASGRHPTPRPDPTPAPAVRVGRTYVRQVVELARQAADAAHALHERGVLHRDIKPGNILVTADGSQAVLMDLGLAQVADEVEGRLTRTRQFVGTLRYASPEQVLAVGGLDRRSDVYNLGATLWELLTLRPLFQATEQTPTPELMRRIQVEEPERPGKYHPGLSRDLEAVVLKCLEKDPGRRYATAAELARDLGRWQAGEPVEARPVGDVQRAWRWCRRNPAWAGTLAALVAIVLGSLGALTGLYLNAERMREHAEREQKNAEQQTLVAEAAGRHADDMWKQAEREKQNAEAQKRVAEHREAGSRAITRFYEEHVLAAARPKGWEGGLGKDSRLREALDGAAKHIDTAFAGQPELEAAVHDALGMTYYYLGRFDDANPHVEKAYAIRLDRLGPDHPDTLSSLHNLALQRWKQDKIPEAEKLGREALAKRQTVLGPQHEDTLWTQVNLGMFVLDQGKRDEGEKLLKDGLEACERLLGPDHPHTLYARMGYGYARGRQGLWKEAVVEHERTLEGRRRALGPDHPDTLRSIADLGLSLRWAGDLERAECLSHEALHSRLRVLGPNHLETQWSRSHLGHLFRAQGRLKEAEDMYRQALDGYTRVMGPDHGETQWGLLNLAVVLKDQRKLDESERVYRQLVAVRQRALGPDHEDTIDTRRDLADLLGERGNLDGAVAEYRDLLAGQRKAKEADELQIALTLVTFGTLLSDKGRPAEAEPVLQEGLAIRAKKLPPGDWRIGNTRSLYGGSLARQKKFSLAEPVLLQAHAEIAKVPAAPKERLVQAVERIVELYEKWGKPDQAEKWREKRLALSK